METRETIALDGRAQVRLTILTELLSGGLSPEEAAMSMGRSVRQVRRLVLAFRARGPAALVHGNRGRVPANRIGDERRARIMELATTSLAGFNGAHLADVLAEEHPELVVSAKSVLRILAGAGMLLQADGSRHDWLEGRGPWLTLIGAVDDATGILTGAVFREQEDAAGYFTVLTQTVHGFGLPVALSTDRHGIVVKDPDRPLTLAEQLEGRRASTQVGRALETLGVRWIPASSPQAKGRSERGWGTAQDRLVSELRRAGASTLDEANVVLARYLPRQTRWFGVPPEVDEPVWRAWPSAYPVEAELCFHYPRRVALDATLDWDGRALALPRRIDGRSWARRRSPSRSTSTGASGSVTGWSDTASARRRSRHLGSGPASDGPSPRPGSRPSRRPAPSCHGHPRRHPSGDDRRPIIPGGATLGRDHGDDLAVRLTVRVAVRRHAGTAHSDSLQRGRCSAVAAGFAIVQGRWSAPTMT